MGDFNDILAKEERIGNRVKYRPSQDFIDCVSNCLLEDVKSCGNFYTWSNKQQGDDRIFSKIDRAMANQSWMDMFPNADVNFMNEELMDHTPAVMSFYDMAPSGKKPFRYFKMWNTHPDFNTAVAASWNQQTTGHKLFQVVSKLKRLKGVLRELNKQAFSDIQRANEKAKDLLLPLILSKIRGPTRLRHVDLRSKVLR
ncbi:hypothetical protein CsatB_019044 [Cannabis sativa]